MPFTGAPKRRRAFARDVAHKSKANARRQISQDVQRLVARFSFANNVLPFAFNLRGASPYSHLICGLTLVYVNTLMIQQILAESEWNNRLNANDRRGITPLIYTHINPYGSFTLDLNSRLPIDPPDPPRFGPQPVGIPGNIVAS